MGMFGGNCTSKGLEIEIGLKEDAVAGAVITDNGCPSALGSFLIVFDGSDVEDIPDGLGAETCKHRM